jgi:hypothetical protein
LILRSEKADQCQQVVAAIVLNVSTSVHTSSGMRDNIMLSQECHLFKSSDNHFVTESK